ncbi:hypothetical protein [Lutibacter citreus]|uniref:hypothetical protein n=1 Tax=Lutibacter citreus TaxID=2138210 RepID=UPI000DBE1282|nr:hypothetical protein [Lutibacter citreus]
MNKLNFEIRKDVINDNYTTFSTQIIIDGRNLIDSLKDYELTLVEKGSENIAGAYDGLDPNVLFANLTNSEDEQNSEEDKSDILDCDCGARGCWTFMINVIEKQDTVIWTGFEQIHMSKNSTNFWDYSDFKDFEFNKNEYFKKLNELITTHNKV